MTIEKTLSLGTHELAKAIQRTIVAMEPEPRPAVFYLDVFTSLIATLLADASPEEQGQFVNMLTLKTVTLLNDINTGDESVVYSSIHEGVQ